MRNGDFSELLALGAQYQIYDPGDDPAASDPGRPVHPRSVPRQHHSGRAGSIRSRSKILGFYPLPNQAGTADGANNYTNPTAVAFETYYTATTRVDHNLSRSAPHLRPLQLGLLGRGERRPLRQPGDRHLPQSQEPRVRDRRRLHDQEQPADQRARRLHAAAVPGAPPQPGLRPGVARLRQSLVVARAGGSRDVPERDVRRLPDASAPGNQATASSPPTSTTSPAA